MPFTPKRLAQFQAAAAETSHYTVPADTLAVVKNIVVANTATVDVSLSLSIVPAGGVAGLQNRIVPGLVIPPLSVVPLDVTQVMAVGDFISAIASLASSLTVTISGMEDPGSNGLSAGTVIGDPPLWGSPVATGNVNADGAATSLPRADHVHKGILAVDQYGAPIATGAANAAGTSLLVPRADHVHQTVGGTVPAALTPGAAAVVGAVDLAARADHAHAINPDPTGWIPLTYLNGWSNYDADGAAGTWADGALYKDPVTGWVYLKGLIKGGTVTNEVAIIQLPVGYRPAAGQGYHQPVISNNVSTFVRIRPDGTITNGTAIQAAWMDVSMVRFRTV